MVVTTIYKIITYYGFRDSELLQAAVVEAFFSIRVTELGMVTEVRPLQPSKADLPI